MSDVDRLKKFKVQRQVNGVIKTYTVLAANAAEAGRNADDAAAAERQR